MDKVFISLLDKYISNPNLRKHCIIVGNCMAYYGQILDQDVIKWYITGLLHDLDWELYPNQHPNKIPDLLMENNIKLDKEIIDAILGHAYPKFSTVPRQSILAKYLFACDELSGFIWAYSLMKSEGLNSITPQSVIKKLKDKAFARNVSREDIYLGVSEIGITLEEHVQNLINAMRNSN